MTTAWRTGADPASDLVEMVLHRFAVAARQDEAGAARRGRAQRRVILFCWPIRASSWNHSSIAVPGARRARIAVNVAGKFFECPDGVRVLRVMARPRRLLSERHRLRIAAYCGLAQRHRERLAHPGHEIAQPPTHHPIDRRDRAALDNLGQRPALGVVELRRLTRRLAVDQPGRTLGVEAQPPVADDLAARPR